ncbi:hypothetical protein KCP73_03660 [Salmonella enterica subsp. enterica]|nr:hypothetical protein KCP73_03660 [Salmonella enterica subsp. enterica]
MTRRDGSHCDPAPDAGTATSEPVQMASRIPNYKYGYRALVRDKSSPGIVTV